MSKAFQVDIPGFRKTVGPAMESISAAGKADQSLVETLNTIASQTNMPIISDAAKGVEAANAEMALVWSGLNALLEETTQRVNQFEKLTGGER